MSLYSFIFQYRTRPTVSPGNVMQLSAGASAKVARSGVTVAMSLCTAQASVPSGSESIRGLIKDSRSGENSNTSGEEIGGGLGSSCVTFASLEGSGWDEAGAIRETSRFSWSDV